MSSSDAGMDESLDGDLLFHAFAALGSLGAVLLLALCLWRLYKLTPFSRPGSASSCSPGAALRRQDVLALPVFVHVSVDGAESVECAVCLGEMKDGERGRLLPACGHRFHVECIDRWFRSSSTCPLCRAAAMGGRSSGEGQKTELAVVAVVVAVA